MTIINLKSFDELVEELIIIIRASTDKLTDFNIGSITRAYVEINGAVGNYCGQKIQELEDAFYLDTATGELLNRRLAEWGLERVSGVKATGNVIFYSYSFPSTPIEIPIGTLIKTPKDADGDFLLFSTTETMYLNSGSTTVTNLYPYAISVPAQCSVEGIQGDVNSGLIVELDESIQGIAGIINLDPFTAGADQETDIEFRERGKKFIQSLAKGTKAALESTILGVQTVNNVQILDWNDVDPLSLNAILPGYMKIILDSDNNSTVPMGEGIMIGPNYIDKVVQIDVWNAIKDTVRAAGVAVLFEQTELIPINVSITVELTNEADIIRTSQIELDTFNSLFLSNIQIFFNELIVNENVRWSKVLREAININGTVAVLSVELTKTLPTPTTYTMQDVLIESNSKAVLGTVHVNGNLVTI